MLFNSFEFAFFFLPLTYVSYFVLRKFAPVQVALGALTALSLVFYAWWNVSLVWVIGGSILFNFGVGVTLARARKIGSKWTTAILVSGLTVDLGALAYFKYWS